MLATSGSRTICGLLGVLVGGFALSGCGTMGTPLPSIDVTHTYQAEDIPVPFSFTFDEEKSWAYTKFKDGPLGLRSCELVYWGDRPVQELMGWYLEQMPIHGWQHTQTEDLGETRMTFSKADEIAEIVLMRTADDKGQFYMTKLIARIGSL